MTALQVAGWLALGLTWAGGGPLVGWLRRTGAVKAVREEAPARHGQKAGTPTMGGLLIVGAVLAAALAGALAARMATRDLFVALGVILVFAVIGGIDDAIGIARKRNLGLRAREKLLSQVPVSLLLGIYVMRQPHLGASLGVPGAHASLNLGWGYPVFCVLFVVGMANAVNLTDGLDGLAAGSVAIAAGALGILVSRAGGAGPLGIVCVAVAGAALGFLWYNAHPAQVFMGDVGSQPLGAALAVVGILAKMELIVLVVGGLFVLEALSVILQVAYFQATGRRLLRMSPLHHHWELSGWTETQTVVRFWVCGALLAVCGVGLGWAGS